MSLNANAAGDSRQLEEALQFVHQQELAMRKCLDTKGKLLDAIRHASTFLAELRSSILTPKQYYELYIAIFDALGQLANFLKEDHPNHHLADIYELVQYAGNIVPRLYLMITVGTVYMSIPDAPVKEIMRDMMDMCRGVQHPIRGLFLRYYLTQTSREYLPVGTSDGPEGNLEDSVHFIITNFVEMNKLWVRLQHQGHTRDREKRVKERQELQILVGSNLVRLSQLEGIDKAFYKSKILPVVLEQVVQCRDVLAQEYLLDVICQVFPDDYHLATLDIILDATANINPNVNINKALLPLVSRLADYATRERDNGVDLEDAFKSASLEDSSKKTTSEEPAVDGKDDNDQDSQNLFGIIWGHFQKLVQMRPDIPLDDRTALLQALVRLSLTWYPDNVEHVDTVLQFALDDAESLAARDKTYPRGAANNVLNLLRYLVGYYPNSLSVLNIPKFLPLLSSQPTTSQRAITFDILGSIAAESRKITSETDVTGLFGLIKISITDIKPDTDEVDAQIITSVAKALHLVYAKDIDSHFNLLQIVKPYLPTESTKYTYPSLLTNVWKLCRRSFKRNHKHSVTKRIFKFAHSCIDELASQNEPDLALRLYVDSAKIADQCFCEEASYEFFANAFSVYEESISDSRAQYQTISIITGALQSAQNFSLDNYDTLISKCALYGSKLLKKADQCRAVYLSSHLWWCEEEVDSEESDGTATCAGFRDEKRVLESLQRALRVADDCMDVAASAELFVEILNRYLYFYDHGCLAVTVRYINGLIELTQANLTNNADEGVSDSPRKHFERTLDYITRQKEVDDKFQQIVW